MWIIKILYLSPPQKNDFDGLNFILKIKYFFLARIKRSCTFAPAKRKNGEKKKIRHVPRHIELTAVLREILKQI